MLQNILDLLQVVKGETENVRIAQGKYLLPDGIVQAYKQVKKENKWQELTQQNM
jgi:hypothetical protein